MPTFTVIDRSGKRRTVTVPENSNTIIDASGKVVSKSTKVKDQRGRTVTVPTKLVDIRTPEEKAFAGLNTQAERNLFGRRFLQSSATAQSVSPETIELQNTFTRFSGSRERNFSMQREEDVLKSRLEAVDPTDTTPGDSASRARYKAREFEIAAERTENPFKAQTLRFGAAGLGVLAGGLNIVEFGRLGITDPVGTGGKVVKAAKNPSQLFSGIGPGLRGSYTASTLGELVGEDVTTLGFGKGFGKIGGKVVSEVRYSAATTKIPIEELADPKVVSGSQRLNIISAEPISLKQLFDTPSPLGATGKTGLFALPFKPTGNIPLRRGFTVQPNRDFLSTGVGGTSVAPPTVGSPQFAIPKSGSGSFSSTLTGGAFVSESSLFPKRRQPTIVAFESTQPFTKLPGSRRLSFGESKRAITSRDLKFFEAPKFAALRGGRAEAEGLFLAGQNVVENTSSGIFRQNRFQKLIGGSAVATRFKGNPILIRQFKVKGGKRGGVSDFFGSFGGSSSSQNRLLGGSLSGSVLRRSRGSLFSSVLESKGSRKSSLYMRYGSLSNGSLFSSGSGLSSLSNFAGGSIGRRSSRSVSSSFFSGSSKSGKSSSFLSSAGSSSSAFAFPPPSRKGRRKNDDISKSFNLVSFKTIPERKLGTPSTLYGNFLGIGSINRPGKLFSGFGLRRNL